MKEEFLNLLRSVKREGIDDLIRFIESTDFFTAPASTRSTAGLPRMNMIAVEIMINPMITLFSFSSIDLLNVLRKETEV